MEFRAFSYAKVVAGVPMWAPVWVPGRVAHGPLLEPLLARFPTSIAVGMPPV